jgi:hypothetical protein
MKKILAAVAALALMMSISVSPAFAAVETESGSGSFPNPVNESRRGSYEDVNNGGSGVTIDVNGYVGDDGDMDEGGDVNPYDINVSVPTKLAWAAFASDAGAIYSPEYEIKNNSRSNRLKVSMLSFGETTNTGIPVGGTSGLTLYIKPVSGGLVGITNQNILTQSIFNGSGKVISPSAGLNVNTSMKFKFDGSYKGQFAAQPKNPKYEMVLLFEKYQ